MISAVNKLQPAPPWQHKRNDLLKIHFMNSHSENLIFTQKQSLNLKFDFQNFSKYGSDSKKFPRLFSNVMDQKLSLSIQRILPHFEMFLTKSLF